MLYVDYTDNYYNLFLYMQYIPIIQPKENIFTYIEDTRYIYYSRENENNVFLFIPCREIYVHYRFKDDVDSETYKHSYKLSGRREFDDYLYFYANNNGYYIYYKLKEDEKDYSYSLENYEEYTFIILNETNIRLYINEIFSDAPEINYTFAIYEEEPDNNYYCEFFKNYYVNQSSDEENNVEIYNFTKNDLKEILNETKYIYYLDLPVPKKYNIHKSNHKFLYKLMGITGPKYKYVKIYDKKYMINCYETCSTCSNIGNTNEQKCDSCLEDKVSYSVYDSYDYYKKYTDNCLDECPKGYYEKDKDCYSCYETCERCSGRGDREEPNCLSCNLSSEYRYLVNVPGRARNCVSSCPNDTILKKMECIKEEGFTRSNIVITIGVVGGFILIIVVIIVFYITDKKILEAKDYTIMDKTETKTPLNFKENEMTDFERKVKENTPKDFDETPGIN